MENNITVNDVDTDFLPLIHDIIKSSERENHEPQKSAQEITQKIQDLQKKIDQARSQIRKLPGVQYNSEQQLKAMDDLRQSLQMKRQLLLKYRHMYSFDVPKY
ncbi:mediator of RNA polymerase II transcription subunit 9 [Sipha flava]|uniref:Mediator of RNA polymerase II transcription subunit 9 n=1 Tax=Sipha flava TaxID=143950 RepID=A0A8B8GU27_9HEMI|nr:mediator of RNA polymerase II transcription subunit 9 [Sipha flava]XP_025425808.1 mediator of RNA polymerase II transcription subunit 9 [Sipha flava]